MLWVLKNRLNETVPLRAETDLLDELIRNYSQFYDQNEFIYTFVFFYTYILCMRA